MYKPEEDLKGYAPVHSDESDDSDAGAGAGAGAAATGAAEAALTAQEIANINKIINAMEGEYNAVADPMDIVDVMETNYSELFSNLVQKIGIETLINCVSDIARTRSLWRREHRARVRYLDWLGIPDDERRPIVEEPDKVWLAKVMNATIPPSGSVWNTHWNGETPANPTDGYKSMSLSIGCPLSRYGMQQQQRFRLWYNDGNTVRSNLVDGLMRDGRIFLSDRSKVWVKLEDADYDFLKPYTKKLDELKDKGELVSVDSKTFGRHYRELNEYIPKADESSSGGKKRSRRLNKTRRLKSIH